MGEATRQKLEGSEGGLQIGSPPPDCESYDCESASAEEASEGSRSWMERGSRTRSFPTRKKAPSSLPLCVRVSKPDSIAAEEVMGFLERVGGRRESAFAWRRKSGSRRRRRSRCLRRRNQSEGGEKERMGGNR